jgi:polyhydroxybutyrate depolymerase
MFKWTVILILACVELMIQPAADAADACADMSPGLNQIMVISGGQQQRIDVVLPASFSPTKRVPLVIGLHPSGGSGVAFDQDTGLSSAATAKGFAVMLPDGGIRQSPSDGDGHYWNIPGVPLIGGGAVPKGARDDVRFIADAIDHLIKPPVLMHVESTSRVSQAGRACHQP